VKEGDESLILIPPHPSSLFTNSEVYFLII
jgi:hypothetical protein